MHIIKLDAIDSTNSYLRDLLKKDVVPNYTVVVAEEQLKGRGQRGTSWLSERFKNLTFSILIRPKGLKASDQFYLSMCVSLSLISAVKKYVKSNFEIKWPNDIMAGKDKVAGILIENVLQDTFVKHAIIGIGLNVNQELFDTSLNNVSSLKNIGGQTIVREMLLNDIISSLKENLNALFKKNHDRIKSDYLNSMYKFMEPSMFKTRKGALFLGKIIDVSEEGYLVVKKDNDTIDSFDLKEIKIISKPE